MAGAATVGVFALTAASSRRFRAWNSTPATAESTPSRRDGDYDGDGDTDIAVFRPSNGYWFVRGGTTTQFGTSGDVPVPGDYNADGRSDVAVFRPSNGYWFVTGGVTTQFGASGDIPLPLPNAIRRFFFA